MPNRTVIQTSQAPAAIGPYSQGIRSGNLIFTAGQIPIDPATDKLIEGSFEDQVHRVLRNLEGILTAAGSSLDRVVKFTVFVTDLGNFSILNQVFAQYFQEDPPARSAARPTGGGVGPALHRDEAAS